VLVAGTDVSEAGFAGAESLAEGLFPDCFPGPVGRLGDFVT
jgi:hypothetical protein